MQKYLGLFILISSCQINPQELQTQIIGTWQSEQEIQVGAGTGTRRFTSIYREDGTAELTREDIGIAGTLLIENFLYEVGYNSPKNAIVFYDPNPPHTITNLPLYFYFQNNQLVTSTNLGMKFSRKWNKI